VAATTAVAGDATMTTHDMPQLRTARPTDLSEVEALLTAYALPLDGVRGALPAFVVAETAQGIVGVAGLEMRGTHALLRSVAVAETWRAHGLGRALVTQVITDAKDLGLDGLYLLTTTAAEWFPRFGFRETTRDAAPTALRETVEFQRACPSSATVMMLSLKRAEDVA
jgi:amino-acid N-acetyltransferase